MAIYLFHSSLSPSTPTRGIQYDEALRLNNNGHKIYFLYCNSLMTQCFNNIVGNKAICYRCKMNFKEEKRKYGEQINFIELNTLVDDLSVEKIKNLKFDYADVEDIKKITYKDINIGIGALSGYISQSRNLFPLIDDKFRLFFDENLYNAALTVEAVYNAINQFRPNHIVLTNGRFADSRPIWEIAKKNKLPFTTLEAIYGVNDNFKAIYENSTPHSIDKNTELINKFWDNSTLSYDSKLQIGSSFFERRKSALYSGDKIYTKNQIKGLLPVNWDKTKHNIVIFNSSEDEFATLGNEFDRYKLFSSQMEGLIYIKEKLRTNSDIKVTLRIHPNLSEIKFSYAKDLLKLKSDNFDVIEGNSAISSYELIDHADTVVVFGSTIGIEAVYWNKPTILLAGAMYYKLNCCYIPNSSEELLQLLISRLNPKDNIEAVKFGFYRLNEQWEKPSVIDFRWSKSQIHIFNIKIQFGINNWKKLFNSRKLYSIFYGIKYLFIRIYFVFTKNKGMGYILPTKENPNNLK